MQERMFSRPVQREIIKRFKSPQSQGFFQLYVELFQSYRNGELLSPVFPRYATAIRFVRRFLASEAGTARFQEAHSKLRVLLRRLDEADRSQRAFPLRDWNLIAYWYARALVELAAERDLYLQMAAKAGSPRWTTLRRLSPRQEEAARVRKNNPELYEAKQNVKRLRQIRDDAIRAFALEGGDVQEKRLMRSHPPFLVGTDPVTGEQVVFDVDGERIPIYPVPPEVTSAGDARKIAYRDLYAKYRQRDRLRRRVFPSEADLEDLRQFTPDDIEQRGEGPEYDVALTDDKAKAHQVTRLLKVRKVQIEDAQGVTRTEEVIVSGRFQGIALADMANRAGRMLEGTAYDYDPTSNRAVPLLPLERKGADGQVEVKVTREPYITMKGDRLYVTIPASHAYAPHRNALKKLAGSKFSNIDIHRRRGSRMISASFDPADFADIRDALGGAAVSQAAVRKFQEYFEELAGYERALSAQNLRNYTADAISGFRDVHPSGKPISLMSHQQESIASLEIRGWRGVIALGTGLGKTLVGLGSMLKMDRDGVGDEISDSNGKYLIVAPTSLVGNFIQEIHAFVEDADNLLDRVDTLSHGQFRKALQQDSQFGANYIAIFIDEGDVLSNPDSKTSRAVQALRHPRKIILTASPMKKDPLEARVLIGIANGEDYSRREDRRKLRQFNALFVDRVGGRAVGVKRDPHKARDLRVFMRQNLFFRDKTTTEIGLPALEKSSTPLPMDPHIEEMYRTQGKSIAKVLKGMVAKWRDRNPDAKDTNIEAARVKFARTLGNLQRLSNLPDEIHLEEHLGRVGSWDLINRALQVIGAPGVASDATLREVSSRIITLPPGRRADLLDALIDLDETEANALLPLMEDGNPKLNKTRERLANGVGQGDRFIVWTDSPDFAHKTIAYLSSVLPVKKHAVGLSSAIEVWQDGRRIHRYRKKKYTGPDGEVYEPAEWQVYVLKHELSTDPEVLSIVLTGSYAFGHNLQRFNKVIHLDRDTWNTQKMAQRTARSHRYGAVQVVQEEILDATFSSRKNRKDATLDEIRGYLMELESDVFDEFIVQAQTEAMGAEWFGMRHLPASLYEVNRQAQEISLSPYIANIANPGN